MPTDNCWMNSAMRLSDRNLDQLAADAAVTAGLLHNGSVVALFSFTTLLAGLLPWLLGHPAHPTSLLAAFAIAGAQGFFALRVRFDATIFGIWASRWRAGADPTEDLAAFDKRIGRSGIRTLSLRENLDGRCQGALRLLHRQILCTVLQVFLTAVALWT
jgi:hypothetical protein